MKPLNKYIQEKLIINKDYKDYRYHDNMIAVNSFDELRKIIEDRYDKLGAGTKENPIDFNDIDVSNLDSFYNEDEGIFENTYFKYIDISYWDVSNVTDMEVMFNGCYELESVGDLSYWDVSKVTNMSFMFCDCHCLNPDLSDWDVSNVTDMKYMFYGCVNFNQNVSSRDVSKVKDMCAMFKFCKSFNQDISNWDVSKVRQHVYMFEGCPIKEEYKPKF